MIYIYDLVLNWSNKKRYEFFEWSNNDEIEYIKKIPIFRIENFDEVVNYNFKVNSSFLNKILYKTEVYNNKSIDKVEYCCIFCDECSTNAIACEFNEEGILVYSSNIYLLDLEEILSLSKKIKSIKLEGEVVDKNNLYIFNDVYLTRKEKIKKKLLLDNINSSYLEKDIYKLKYYYYKVFNKESNDIEEMKRSLIKSINTLYNYKHDELYNFINLNI